MKAQCSKCKKWFQINQELETLIEEGYINALDINLCDHCSEVEAEAAEYEESIYNFLKSC